MTSARRGMSAARGRQLSGWHSFIMLTVLWFYLTPGVAMQGIAAEAGEKDRPGAASSMTAFPLKVAPGGRYLEDSAGKPFLLQGDAAWSLISQLKREEVEFYLRDRRARGFNTLLVSLIEHRFATNAPANIYGDEPFTKAGDFSTPNEAYFGYAEWVLQRARDAGFLILLAPAYIGARDTNEGWYKEMAANGVEKLREYGRYVGKRFRQFDNIIWAEGGDDNPRDKNVVRAVAEGISQAMPGALHTAHCAPDTSPADFWAGEPWLKVDNVYTYRSVYDSVERQYSRSAHVPVFLIESGYENEHKATEQSLRTQSYSALLAGAFGQVFGNNPIWHFSGPALFATGVNWRDALSGRGSQSMTYLRKLFDSLAWWRLQPDFDGKLVTSGTGRGRDRSAAARADDGSFAVVYLPSVRTISVDMARLSGSEITARWYDPADGTYKAVKGSPFPTKGVGTFRPAGGNGAGFGDWVLILTAK